MKRIAIGVYLDVLDPRAPVPVNGEVVIGCSNAPAWKICEFFHKCISEGGAVIYVGPGIGVSRSRGDYIAAYSTDDNYPVGSKLPGHIHTIGQHDLPGYADGSWLN